MFIKLLCDDGAEFHARVADLSNAAGVEFRGRHFFFRNVKFVEPEPFCEFEEGREITLTENEIIIQLKEKA